MVQDLTQDISLKGLYYHFFFQFFFFYRHNKFQLMAFASWWLFFIINPRHLSAFGIGKVQISNFLFDNKRLY